MRRREKPAPVPEPIDPAKIRELLEKAAAAHNAGERMHRHPALEALGDICGPLGCYVFAFIPADKHIAPEDLDKMMPGLCGLAKQERDDRS